MAKRAVFLDRDGVINESIVREGRPYPPACAAETVLAEHAERCLTLLRESGFLLVVVTNQPDVRRGTMSRENVDEIHRFLSANLPLDDIFACYHDDRDHCACRKPKPGLLFEAAEKHGVDVSRSYVVGDRWRDMAAGVAAGCRTVFIDHGYNERSPESPPDIHVRSLCEAVDRILGELEPN